MYHHDKSQIKTKSSSSFQFNNNSKFNSKEIASVFSIFYFILLNSSFYHPLSIFFFIFNFGFWNPSFFIILQILSLIPYLILRRVERRKSCVVSRRNTNTYDSLHIWGKLLYFYVFFLRNGIAWNCCSIPYFYSLLLSFSCIIFFCQLPV